MKISEKLVLFQAILVGLFAADFATAADANWVVTGTGAWETPSNWSPPGVPSIIAGSHAKIFNGGTAEINQPGQSAQYITLAFGLGDTGYVHLVAGTLETFGDQNLCRGGMVIFTQEAGTTNTSGGGLTLAQENGSRGTYRLKGGILNVTNGNIYVGYRTNTIGTVEQSGGVFGNVGAGKYFHLGFNEVGAVGNYVLSGDGKLMLTNLNNYLYVGYNGSGSFIQSNGTVSVSNSVMIGKNANALGLYRIENGSLTVGASLILGESNTATGTLQVVGSAATISAVTYSQTSNSTLDVQFDGNGVSPINVSGGATLGGTLKITGNPLYNHSATATVINASSALNSTFISTNFVPPLISANIIYDTVNRDLKLTNFRFPQPVWNVATTGAWETAVNWGGAVPNRYDDAVIGNGGTAEITLSGQITGTLALGTNSASAGNVHLISGTLETISCQTQGVVGASTFTQESGTTNLCGGFLHVGESGTQSVYNLNGGLLSVPSSEITVGNNAGSTGTIQQAGGVLGSIGASQTLSLGRLAGAVGNYVMTGGSILLTNNNFAAIGNSGVGNFTQSNGTVVVSNDVTVAKSANAVGNYRIVNGSLAVGQSLLLGGVTSATGTLQVVGSAATINVNAYTQTVNSTLDIQFDGSGVSPITVAGNASLGGTLKIARDALYSRSATVTVINASTISGTFSRTNCVAPLTGVDIIYDAGNGDVKLTNFRYLQPIWSVGTGAWETGGNWAGFVPNRYDNAVIGNGGTAQITQSGQISGSLSLGTVSAASGNVQLNAGTLETVSYQNQGILGPSTFTQESGTTNLCGGFLFVGEWSTQSIYRLNGGFLSVPTDEIDVGYKAGAKGTIEQTSGVLGSIGFDKYLNLGREAGSVGNYVMNGGSILFTNSNYAIIGNSGIGHFTQNNGTVVVDKFFYIGNAAGGYGDYTMSNGSFMAYWPEVGTASGATGVVTVTGGTFQGGYKFSVGHSGRGSLFQSGGTVGVTNQYLYVGYSSTSVGAYTLSGTGKLMLTNAANYLYVGFDGNGTFIQSNGTVAVTNDLMVGKNANAVGLYRIENGSLAVGNKLILGESASATGTLQVVGSAATINAAAYSQTANSTLDIQFDGNGVSPINVVGLATLGGTLKITGNPFYSHSTTVTVINAGSISGTFSSTNFVPPLIGATVIYDTGSGDVKLTNFRYPQPVWNVAGTNAWETAGNWSSGTVPNRYDDAVIGNGGTAEITQVGQVAGTLALGTNSASSGNVHLISGTLETTSCQTQGVLGASTFTQESGTTNLCGGFLHVGEYGTQSVYNLNGGLLSVPSSEITVGNYSGSTGTIQQAGGVLGSIGSLQYLSLGRLAGAVGNYVMTGGSILLTNNNYAAIGYSGVGNFTQSNGTVIVSNDVTVAKSANAVGNYRIVNGSLAVGQSLLLGGVTSATGTLQVVGSAATITANTYTQTVNSTLDIQCDASGVSPITVAGNASLNGTLKISRDELYSHGATVTVINASTISGTFSRTNCALPLTGVDIIYDTGNGDVKLTNFRYLQPVWSNPGTGPWEVGSNWSGLVPTRYDDSVIGNGGTAVITQAGQISGSLSLGTVSTASGNVHLTNGTLETVSYQNQGKVGPSTFIQENGTTNLCGGFLYVGELSTQSLYRLNGGLLSVPTDEIDVGYKSNSVGTIEQAGGVLGSIGNGKYLNLGRLSGSAGNYLMNGGSILFTNSNFASIGCFGIGHFMQNNGSVTVDQQFNIGKESGAYGDYTLNNGSFLARWPVVGEMSGSTGVVTVAGGVFEGGDKITIGQYGCGTLYQTGGTVGITNQYLYLGERSSGVGTYVLSGTGKLMLTNTENYLFVGEYGNGSFVQSNGTVDVKRNLTIARWPGSSGSYWIKDGALTVRQNLEVGEQASATGSLQVVGSRASIQVLGTYSQNASSTLWAQLDANGISPIMVTGSASLNGTLKITGNEYLSHSATVTVINAGSLISSFSNTNFVPPLISAKIIYDVANGDVKLTSFQFPPSGSIYLIR